MANVLDATLYQATLHNDIKAVEDALNKGANPNANDFNWDQSTALIESCNHTAVSQQQAQYATHDERLQ